MAYGTVNADVIGTSVAGSNLGAGNASTMKNRIINGAMVIDQRNAGAAQNALGSSYIYTLDRWAYYGSTAGKFNSQQNAGSVTPPTGFSNYLGLTVASAVTVTTSDQYFFKQSIEGYNTSDLGWGTAQAKTLTLSFQVYSSLTGTFSVAFKNSAGNRSYVSTYTISSANTWTTVSITVAGDTSGTWVGATNGVGINIWWNLGAGSSLSTASSNSWQGADYQNITGSTQVIGTAGATFYITGVQLEVGSSATGFEYRQYGQELALCYRYYYYLGGDTAYQSINTVVWYTAADAVGYFSYPVTMRTAPSIAKTGTWVVLGGGGTVGQTLSADQLGNKTVQLGFGGGSGGTSGQASTLRASNDTSLRVTFNAEL
jgi:hypothetical protein